MNQLGPYAIGIVHVADCLVGMAAMPDACVDAIVTDPPYGLSFMGKDWDHGVPGVAFWAEALRVVKPGSHLLAFGGTRTFHRLACAIEDAGWEIRDCLSWLYGQGFPKSLDVSKAIDREAGIERDNKFGGSFDRKCGPTGNKRCSVCGKWLVSGNPCRCPRPQDDPVSLAAREWSGWGTALKPAWEPIILARQPLDGTVAQNVLAHGTGAIHVDGCRIPTDWTEDPTRRGWQGTAISRSGVVGFDGISGIKNPHTSGRWPANVVLDEEAGKMLDEQSGDLASGLMRAGQQRTQDGGYNGGFPVVATGHDTPADRGGASRFFYTAKATRSEREAGCESMDQHEKRWGGSIQDGRPHTAPGYEYKARARNNHPTVKPVDLMRWLCRLVTPPGGIVLDPFAGSGTTGCAAKLEGLRFVGFEQDAHYTSIANARIAATTVALGEVKRSDAKQGQQIGLLGETA